VPTGRGWLVISTGVGLWIAGRIFGSGGLEQLGFGLVALVGLALVVVSAGKHRIEVSRSVVPDRVQSGRDIAVELTLKNEGRGSAPLLLIEDRVPAELAGRARFALAGLESGGERTASYPLRPSRRGRYSVGPLTIVFSDPFGVARVRAEAAGSTSFLAYPRIEPLALPRDSGKRRTMAVAARRQPTGAQGEDFYTLREYVEGDDLRHINWPATAKRGRYMVRQEETPWHARATILLDDRKEGYVPASFERAVEAAASLAELYHRSGYTFRLTGAHHPGGGNSRGAGHLHRCLDHLASVQPSRDDAPRQLGRRLLELESQSSVEGVLIVVAGGLDEHSLQALIRCGRRFKIAVALSFPPHRFATGNTRSRWEGEGASVESSRLLDRSGVKSLVLGPSDRLGASWSALWRATPHASVAVGGGEQAWDRKPELA
jgi:uncharacterized protein (DUF58 family)